MNNKFQRLLGFIFATFSIIVVIAFLGFIVTEAFRDYPHVTQFLKMAAFFGITVGSLWYVIDDLKKTRILPKEKRKNQEFPYPDGLDSMDIGLPPYITSRRVYVHKAFEKWLADPRWSRHSSLDVIRDYIFDLENELAKSRHDDDDIIIDDEPPEPSIGYGIK